MKKSSGLFLGRQKEVAQFFCFAVIMKIAQLLVIQPFIHFIFRFGLQTTGFGVLFNNNMLSFFLTPIGFMIGLGMILLLTAVSFFEFSVMVLFVKDCREKSDQNLLETIKGFSAARESVRPFSFISYFLYVFIFLPIAGLGVSSSLFPSFQIPNFITGELAKTSFGGLGIVLFRIIVLLFFFASVYALPIFISEGCSFFSAVKRSTSFIKGHWQAFWKMAISYLAVWGILLWLPETLMANEGIFSTLLDFPASLFSSAGVLSAICLLYYLFGQVTAMPLLVVLVTKSYLEETAQISAVSEKFTFPKVKRAVKRLIQLKASRYILCFLMISSILLTIWGYLEIWNSADLHEPIVIGHRGSTDGVENTLEALQGAIEAQADYAEIDILLSKDGVPMVIHDDSLKRLANMDAYVHKLTAAELSAVALSQNGYSGKISTLEEVLEYTDGKIELAVELKLHQHEEKNLVDEVAKVMEKHGKLEDAIFLSLDYSLVDEMNRKHPETTSGYCIFGGLGYLSPVIIRSMNIDFVFIEEWMAKRENLMDFRRSWLPVYIWTVNQQESMKTFLELGANGLVTDYPAFGKLETEEIIQENPKIYLDEKEWRE